ncbi:oligosaccharide flippase family protein, partial [Parabacteroides faecis]
MDQLKAGALLSYVVLGLNTLIGLLYTPFMLRMLGQSEFGLYSLAASVIAYLTVLDLGFGNAIVRYTAKYRAEGKQEEQYEMFGMFFLLYLFISALAFILGVLLVANVDCLFDTHMTVDEMGKMRLMLLLMAFNLAFTFPMSIWGAIITAYENFVFQKIINIARILLNPIVMIVLLLFGYKAVAMVVVTTFFNVATLVINWIYCKRKLHVRLRFTHFKWGFLKEVSIYSFWIFLNAIMDRIYWSTGQFVLGIFQGAAVVAVYAVAIQLHNLYIMFSTAISGLFLPKVTAMVTRNEDSKVISDLFIRTGRIQFIVIAFVLAGFIIFGRQFIQLWAGEGYENAYWISLLFFIPLTVPLIQNLGITILQARNEMKFRSILYVIIAIASLGLSIPMAKSYGGIGCAFATALALTAGQVVVMNIYYQRKQGIDIIKFWK